MKPMLCAVLLSSFATGAFAADVGVSIRLGDPGFFGELDLGDAPSPQLIYPSPVIIERHRDGPALAPVYLHVPPGRERNWRRYCHEYNACNRPVYFVRDSWYRDVYVRHYRDHHADRPGERREERRDERRDEPAHEGRHDEERREH